MTTPVTDYASTTVPLWLQSLDANNPILLPAEHARAILGGLITPDAANPQAPLTGMLPGVAGYNGEVTATGVAGQVSIAPFIAVLPGKVGTQGSYLAAHRIAKTLTAVLPPTGQFVGVRVCAEIRDAVYDGGTHYDLHLYLLAGNPAATAAAVVQATVPANSFLLRSTTVDSSGVVTLVNANAPSPQRTVAVGGIRPVSINDTLAGAYGGQWQDVPGYSTTADPTGGGRMARWNPTTGKWDFSVPRYWGTLSPSAWPTTAQGAQYGDTLYCSEIGTHFVLTVGNTWRQLTSTRGATYNSIVSQVAAFENAGGTFPDGHQFWDNAMDRLYAADGSKPANLKLLGGAPGASVTAGFVASANWTVANCSLRNLGNGMADVYIEATRTTSALAMSSGATGNIANVTVVTLPTGWSCLNAIAFGAGATGRLVSGYMGTGGISIALAAAAGNSDIAIGEVINFNGIYPLLDPTAVANY